MNSEGGIISTATTEGRRLETEDPRFRPYYTVPQVARYLKMPSSTLRSWVVGYSYPTQSGKVHSGPVISPPESPEGLRLSFTNLIEAYVLLSLRTVHRVTMGAVREALGFAEEELGIQRLLIREELRTDKASLFLDRYGELIDLSRSGQYALKSVLSDFLERVEYDEDRLAGLFFPHLHAHRNDSSRVIAIDPEISFGRPVVWRRGITTSVVAERVDAGEHIGDVAADYRLREEEVAKALIYERAA